MAGLGMAGVFLAMALFSKNKSHGTALDDAVVSVALCSCFGVLIAGVLYYLRWRQPLEVTPHGIDGFDTSGGNCFVRWDQMHDWVAFTAYLFVPCVLVRHTALNAGPLQVPLMLERREELRALVAQYAGAECPLVEALA